MRSIEARFLSSERDNPICGAYIHLARAVRSQGFSRRSLMENFKKLMPEDEYDRADTKALVDYLDELTDEVKKQRRFNIFEKYNIGDKRFLEFVSDPIEIDGGKLATLQKKLEEYKKQPEIA